MQKSKDYDAVVDEISCIASSSRGASGDGSSMQGHRSIKSKLMRQKDMGQAEVELPEVYRPTCYETGTQTKALAYTEEELEREDSASGKAVVAYQRDLEVVIDMQEPESPRRMARVIRDRKYWFKVVGLTVLVTATISGITIGAFILNKSYNLVPMGLLFPV